MNLRKYREKRDFKKSPEPAPKKKRKVRSRKLQFVVQKHAARSLHYDLRLEVDGVLKSWAVPKGPSMDPKDRRLAIMTEDHPYDYKDFEGIIPEGYGKGVVEIWDHGTYYVEEDPDKSEKLMREGLKKGQLHFHLEGERLQGEFVLVHTKENQWLLIKKRSHS